MEHKGTSDAEHLHRELHELRVGAERLRRGARRELLLWIVVSAMLGAVVGYGIALWLVEPVIVVAGRGLRA